MMTTTATARRSRGLPAGVRRWTLILGVATSVQGVWAFLWPRVFYDDFPVPGAEWVSALGPFNDHLSRDFGSALVGLGVVAVAAALAESRDALRATLIGFVAFGVLHLAFHLTTFGEFSAASISIQIASLFLFTAVPLRLLAAMRRGTTMKGITS